eukprot:jgi/Ulvmu1/10243/UM060_0044.1
MSTRERLSTTMSCACARHLHWYQMTQAQALPVRKPKRQWGHCSDRRPSQCLSGCRPYMSCTTYMSDQWCVLHCMHALWLTLWLDKPKRLPGLLLAILTQPTLQIFTGPWTVTEISMFVNNRCTRAAKIGRAFVGDIFASQFSRATTVRKQRDVLRGLRTLQWQYREGRTQLEVQQRLRYYGDLMNAAITEGAMGVEHFVKLSARIEEQLQMEVYKDALAEVNLIKHNVIQAFLESSADPTVVHNFVNVVRDLPCNGWAQGNCGLLCH